MPDDLQRLRDANAHLIDTYRNLVAALGGPELADAYRDALAARLRATCFGWGHRNINHEDVRDVVEWSALEVEREIRL